MYTVCIHIWVGHVAHFTLLSEQTDKHTSELNTGVFSSQVHDHIVEEVHQPNIMKHTVIFQQTTAKRTGTSLHPCNAVVWCLIQCEENTYE